MLQAVHINFTFISSRFLLLASKPRRMCLAVSVSIEKCAVLPASLPSGPQVIQDEIRFRLAKGWSRLLPLMVQKSG